MNPFRDIEVRKVRTNDNPRADYDGRASYVEPNTDVYVEWPMRPDGDGDVNAYQTEEFARQGIGGVYVRALDLLVGPEEPELTVEALKFAAAFLEVEVDVEKLVEVAKKAEALVGSR